MLRIETILPGTYNSVPLKCSTDLHPNTSTPNQLRFCTIHQKNIYIFKTNLQSGEYNTHTHFHNKLKIKSQYLQNMVSLCYNHHSHYLLVTHIPQKF